MSGGNEAIREDRGDPGTGAGPPSRRGVRAELAAAWAAIAVNLRSRDLRRAQLAFGAMWAGEWTATVALAVVAFRDGGAAAVGLVALLRMAPAALIAPFAATVADRVRREVVLAWVGWARAVLLGAAAAAVAASAPGAVVYLLLVAATIAQTLFRPAHSALLPSLCRTPDELTSANVVRGLLDSLATLLGPLAAAALLAVGGPGAAFAAAAVASLWAALLVGSLRYEAPPRLAAGGGAMTLRAALDGVRAIGANRSLALLTALTTVQTFTRGALTVFAVVVSIQLLDLGESGVGLLTGALGAGAVLGSLAASLLVGRGRLACWFGIGVALWGLPLVAVGAIPATGPVILFLAVVGVGNALVDVGVFTLLARLADDAVLARAFAAFEAILTLGVGLGAVATPAVISVLGNRWALVAVGLLAPVAVLASWHALRRLDRRMAVRDADVALIRSVPMLRPLPEATLEWLASRLRPVDVPAGRVVFAQGDPGSDYFLIVGGAADVLGDGRLIRRLGPGDGFGEIALLRDGRRTTTVTATGPDPLLLRTLGRDAFVTAVTGYSPSVAAAGATVDAHLERFAPGDAVA